MVTGVCGYRCVWLYVGVCQVCVRCVWLQVCVVICRCVSGVCEVCVVTGVCQVCVVTGVCGYRCV